MVICVGRRKRGAALPTCHDKKRPRVIVGCLKLSWPKSGLRELGLNCKAPVTLRVTTRYDAIIMYGNL